MPRAALDHPVFYNPAPAVARWQRLKRARTGRWVSLGISVALIGGLWWFYGGEVSSWFWWIVAISLGLSLLLLGWSMVQVAAARRELNGLYEGLALGIGRGGLFAADQFLEWPAVAGLVARPPRLLQGSARLTLQAASGASVDLPLDYLSHSPAAIDGAVRALSGRRSWVDLSALDG